MAESSIRILLVDDHEPFRRFVASTLQQRSELQIVAEVSDGIEAVQKAEELKPDLILLDIGLPQLSGIEAARRIRKLSPISKIIFVSQESSADFVEEAFRLGACGYIFKTDAGKELLAAINAVRHGERFVSSRFASRNFGQSQGPDSLSWPAPNPPHTIEGKGRHEAVFYSDDRSLLENVTQFVGAALKARNAAIVVAIESHRDSLVPMLYAQGLDMGAVIRQGRYVALDAADTLSTLIVNGKLDPVRFMEAFTNLILTATKAAVGKHPRVAVFGEGAHLLWTQGNVQAAVRDEELCNQLTKRHDVDILCSYRQASFQGDVGKHVFQQICSEHSAIYSR